MNIKSNKIVLAVIAVLSFVFAYLYDKWKYNTIWDRCQASDMADSEAYAFVNHHSSLDFMLEGKSRACSMQQCQSYKYEVSDETLWRTQKTMAQIFGVGVPAISKHLKNIFEEGELVADSVISKMETTAADGKNYTTTYYSLDAIIAVKQENRFPFHS